MDTTLAVIKRIEQQLTHLQAEFRRNGFEMPYEAFLVHTGDVVSVEVAPNAPAPTPKEQPRKRNLKPADEPKVEETTDVPATAD